MPIALLGTGVSKGIAIGRARVLRVDPIEVSEYVLPKAMLEDEVARFRKALSTTRRQLREIRGRIPVDAPPDIAAFIDTHLLMLDDATLTKAPEQTIRLRHCNAEWALKLQQDALVKVFDAMDDPYIRTRRDDVEHVIRRVQQALLNDTAPPELATGSRDAGRIVLSDDLSPGDILLIHQQKVAAIVTEHGAPMSHTAIMARSLGVPAIVGMHRAYQYVQDDETVVVDGGTGVLVAGVDEEILDYYRHLQEQERRSQARLRRLRDKPAITRDGVAVTLHANIERPSDLKALKRVKADGVGLYRTEYLYLNRPSPPGEEEQYAVYRGVVEKLDGAPLTLRTLDLGADKAGRNWEAGPNPALGLRAVRYCLQELEVFRTQLRAAVRASAHGALRLLIPMLSNLGEMLQVRRLLDEVRHELAREGKAFAGNIPVGAMIEVPGAALCAPRLAREADFFSIGTNDLIQYTLAADRMDDTVNYLFDPVHPGVLKLVQMTLDAGRHAGIPVAMCGEMAGDPQYTRLLLGMGLTEFSAPPAALLEIKGIITESDTSRLRACVGPLLQSGDPFEIAAGLEQLRDADGPT